MDREVINNIKSLSIDMINEALSGHPGIALSATSIIYTIYSKHLNTNLNDLHWINRDRFVLSCGHGSSMLYSTLFMAGYNISKEELKTFRKINSRLTGHPKLNIDMGVEMTTGPLGQGFATSVGMALAGKILFNKFKMSKKSKIGNDRSLIDYNVYCLVSDGDLMEGISYEAASLAGTLKLDNLIVLYDSNNISLDGNTSMSFKENVIERFKSMGWHTELVKDGLSVNDIDRAINKAKESKLPSFIEVKTTLGYGSLYENSNKVHGKPLTDNDIKQLKEKLKVPQEPFYVNLSLKEYFKKQIEDRSIKKYNKWKSNYDEYVTTNVMAIEKFKYFIDKNPFNISSELMVSKEPNSTLNLNNYYINYLLKDIPNVVLGSADLALSTKLYMDEDIISENNFDSKNIEFGVREHAMGAILNGLALCNLRPFGSTYLAFSDYLKPSLRLSCLMNLPVTYVFTHDSINVGYDGETHQPIEQLASLRCIPNLNVYRPSDTKELIGSIYSIMNNYSPSCLILSKKDTIQFIESSVKNTLYGGYILRKEKEKLHAIIVSTGSELEIAYNIANKLYDEYKLDIRVVSMPCMNIYEKMNEEYKNNIIPRGYRTIVIEAGSHFGWDKYVYNKDYLITIDQFGESGSPKEVLTKMQFDYDSIYNKIKNLLLK